MTNAEHLARGHIFQTHPADSAATVILIISHPSGIGFHGNVSAEKAKQIATFILDDLIKFDAANSKTVK